MFRKKCVNAVIVSKRLTPVPRVHQQTATRGWYFNYGFAIVQFDDGKQRELEVYKKDLFDSLLVNTRGLLTFRGYTLLAFDRRKDF